MLHEQAKVSTNMLCTHLYQYTQTANAPKCE